MLFVASYFTTEKKNSEKEMEKIRRCEEFRIRKFGFYHSDPEVFHRCQWPLPPALYLLYRWVTAAYMVALKIYTCVLGWHHGLHFIFLTNWTYTVLTLSFVYRAVGCTIDYFNGLKNIQKTYSVKGATTLDNFGQNRLPWNLCCAWILLNVTNAAALLVSITFWTAIYNGEGIHFTNFNTHGLNSVFVLVDLAMTSIPVRLLHVYQPMAYVVIYGIFSIIYWATGGVDVHGHHYIYHVLDYGGNTKIAATLATCLVVVAIPVLHAIVFGLYKLRVFVFDRTIGGNPYPVRLEMDSVHTEA